MKFKIGDKIIYKQDLTKYNLGILSHKGEIVDYSKGTDIIFGEYEVSYYHKELNARQRCTLSEEDLILDIASYREDKINKILKPTKS